MLQAVDAQCKLLNTQPQLRQLLLTTLAAWLSPDHDESLNCAFTVPSDNAPSKLKNIIYQQNKIGWDHIFQGFFSLAWSEVQDEYYAQQAKATESTQRTGRSWQIANIHII
jgi:hypothetical protein